MMVSSFRRYVFFFSLLIVTPQFAKAQSSRQCFLPNGILSGDTPCDPKADHSMCCGSPERCLSNGLCLDSVEAVPDAGPNTGNRYSRGTCTDKTWKSPFCPQNCVYNKDLNSNPYLNWTRDGVMVWGCNKLGYAQPAAYCCESVRVEQQCCSTGTFSLPGATIGAALAIQTFPPPTGTMTTSSSGPPSSSASSSSSTTSSPPETAASSTGTGNNPTEGSATAGLTEGAKIGIGVGVGLGSALLIVGALFLYVYRRSHPPVPSSSPPMSPSGYGPDGSSIHHAESITSGGTYVNGRYVYAASSKPEESKGVSVTELGGHKSFTELDNGQGLPSEMSTWEHSPAELEAGGGGNWPPLPKGEFEPRQSFRPSGGGKTQGGMFLGMGLWE